MNSQTLKYLNFNEKFLSILSQSLSLTLSTNKQITDCLISSCGIHVIDENLNEIKSKVIEIYTKTIFLVESNKEYTEIIKKLIELFSRTLIRFMNLTPNANYQFFIDVLIFFIFF